jgi:hypothetical protein
MQGDEDVALWSLDERTLELPQLVGRKVAVRLATHARVKKDKTPAILIVEIGPVLFENRTVGLNSSVH